MVILLWHAGRTNVKTITPTKFEVIDDPQDAFAVWKGAAVRGRTLYLFDRYLEIQPVSHAEFRFRPEEFSGDLTVKSLCSAILRDRYKIRLRHRECGIDMLNEILESRYFYAAWKEKKSLSLSSRAKRLIRASRGYPAGFRTLSENRKKVVIQLNRLIIEETYPLICPKSVKYRAEEDNYLYLAIYEKIINKIYHIIPDDAWPEVARNLSVYPYVYFGERFIRMAIHEGVPLIIMRFSDFDPVRDPVLVSVASDCWSDVEMERIFSLLSGGNIRSDLITVSGRQEDGLAGKSVPDA
ncbi:MAG: hypothetical protein HZA17_08885 [Nitrospirae bacterium]|nr:hypothetical protein [Nitrospirota bacterium]